MRSERRFRAVVSALALSLSCAAMPVGAGQRLPATGTVEVAFSPAGDPQKLIIDVIDAARRSIHVQTFIFTSRVIADALIRAKKRGVEVEVMADAEMNRRGSGKALPGLLEAGIPLAFETQYAAAHNKVIIVDAAGPGCVVVTGSYNLTWSASNKNAENVLVLRDNCALAGAYLVNWKRHRSMAERVTRLPMAK